MKTNKKEITFYNVREVFFNIRWANGTDYVLIQDIAKYGNWNLSDLSGFIMNKSGNIDTEVIVKDSKVLGRAITKFK